MRGFILFVVLLAFTVPCMAQSTITFAWDLSVDDANLGVNGGYHLYASKQSGVYNPPAAGSAAPGATTMTIPVPGLGKWYFVARAFIADATESDNSNEVSTVIKPKPPTLKSAAVAILTAPVRAVTKLAGLFKEKKNLRIIG